MIERFADWLSPSTVDMTRGPHMLVFIQGRTPLTLGHSTPALRYYAVRTLHSSPRSCLIYARMECRGEMGSEQMDP